MREEKRGRHEKRREGKRKLVFYSSSNMHTILDYKFIQLYTMFSKATQRKLCRQDLAMDETNLLMVLLELLEEGT